MKTNAEVQIIAGGVSERSDRFCSEGTRPTRAPVAL